MHSELKVISESQLKTISAGHGDDLSTLGLTILILELPHIFMGIREFVNYWSDIAQHGCKNVDEEDHFTNFFCKYTSV